jgi:hypothetical protein
MLSIKAAKGNFFDRESVLKATDAATRRVLSRFGAFVWRRSKSSIRKRRKSSLPGKPPSSHVGLLRNLIFFTYDASARSVVIGPVLINRSTGAPEVLEHGGLAKIDDGKRVRRVPIAARPYMGPALQAELPGLPAMWKNSVKGKG